MIGELIVKAVFSVQIASHRFGFLQDTAFQRASIHRIRDLQPAQIQQRRHDIAQLRNAIDSMWYDIRYMLTDMHKERNMGASFIWKDLAP